MCTHNSHLGEQKVVEGFNSMKGFFSVALAIFYLNFSYQA